jgi:Pyruvate/2-oxoacid:ferredoxin oxidoreductase gamma subunit
MKHTVLIVGLLLSMAVNSEWRKVKDGLYEVMDKNDAKIINISSAGQDN